MDMDVWPDGILALGSRRLRCALGRAGVTADKQEGDHATPAGDFPLRRVLYRADRGPRPETGLPVSRIGRDDGWCDDPGDPEYNQQVRLPHAGHCERLWREDGIYDILVVLGHNDDPPVPGRGSAIFLHAARSGYLPTEGCVALAIDDLRALLRACSSEARLHVHAAVEPGPPAAA